MNSSVPEVTPGQLWIDNDTRTRHWAHANRYVLVDEIEGDKAKCRTWSDQVGGVAEARKTRIAVRRFRPNSTGYRLVDGSAHSPLPRHGRPV